MPALRAWYKRLRRGERIALIVLLTIYVAALLAPVIAPYPPAQQLDIVTMNNNAPSLAHPFGTDRFSRDLLSRVLYGTLVSLSVATLAVIVSAIVGTLYGLVAATFGGVVDVVLMRTLDGLLSIPRVLLLIAILALWDPVPLWMLVVLLGITGWFEVARLVRAEGLAARERDYIAAARSLGAGRTRIMLRHLLPNVLGPVIVTTAINVGNVIVLEAGLSFIGIGARDPAASLGTMFQDGTEAFSGTWWGAFFPGLVLVTIVLCVNVVGDALRASLDPRQLPAVRLGTRTADPRPVPAIVE